MRSFEDGQRVILDQPEAHKLLKGKAGRVVRRRRADAAAWVEMDDDIPVQYRHFPAGDRRCNHVMLYPQECRPE